MARLSVAVLGPVYSLVSRVKLRGLDRSPMPQMQMVKLQH